MYPREQNMLAENRTGPKTEPYHALRHTKREQMIYTLIMNRY